MFRFKKFINNRFNLYFAYLLAYLIISFVVRVILNVLSISNIDFSAFQLLKIYAYGFYFDLFVALAFSTVYLLYLILFPKKWIGTFVDKIFTYFIFTILLFITLFSFFGEFPFWEEFNVRYNFIAVDYLIYTYEVIENINQSYPIPLIIALLLVSIGLLFFVFTKLSVFKTSFEHTSPSSSRLKIGFPLLVLTFLLGYFSENKQAEYSSNTYVNELSKNGVFSFFAAYRANELDYDLFYKNLEQKEAYSLIREELRLNNTLDSNSDFAITRIIHSDSSELRPNIVLITIESFSASFLETFGNTQKLTPNFENLAKESLFFTNMYATGTRTVRGMEALTLSVPPTPGNSIIRRPNNDNLFSIATILREKNYDLKFIYGGDGYFDNMNSFFGGQGFDIVDRNRGNPLFDNINTKRYTIPDQEVSFENAWGICDEDLYNQAIKYANTLFNENKPFFQFIMTTSNHRPYTFPENKIDLPQGKREGAVKYTDFALGNYIEKAKKQPWFKNTVFVVVADHCANSAGKWEINIEKHHIPAIIYNLSPKMQVDKLCSQIDLMPTLFSILNWNYKTNFYGNDVLEFKNTDERALIANYRTLGLLKNNIFTQLTNRKTAEQFSWDPENKKMLEIKNKNKNLENITISYYQTSSERFKTKMMKEQKQL